MKLPTLRVLSASGLYLRGRLRSLCNSLGLRRVRSGSRAEVIDGYILRANAVNGRVQGLLLDPPGVIAIGVVAPDNDELVRRDVPVMSLATHRDGLSPTLKVLPEDPVDSPPYAFATSAAVFDLDGTIGAPSAVVGFGNVWHALMDSSQSVIRSAVNAIPPGNEDLTPEVRASLTFFLNLGVYFPVRQVAPWGQPVPDSTTSLAYLAYISESAFPGYLLYTDVTVDPAWSPLTDEIIRGEFLGQPPPLVTVEPLASVGESGLRSYLAAVPLAEQVSAHDAFGARVLSILRVDGSGQGDSLSLDMVEVLTTALSSYDNPLMVPATVPAEPTADLLERHRYNAFFPTYMVQRADGMVVAFIRAATDQPKDPEQDDDPESIRYYALDAVVFDPWTGAVVNVFVLEDPQEAAEQEDAPPLISAIGAATDGEVVVYIADGEVAVVTADSAFSHTYPTGGFFRFPSGGGGGAVSGAGWEQSVPPTAPSVGWQRGEYSVDSVTYIGNGKFVFPVTLTDLETEPDTYDLTIAQYSVTTGGVSTLGTVLDDLPAALASEEDRARSVAPIQCIQREIADEEGEVVMPAVLLVSVGDSNTDGEMYREGRGTWISHDSGETWAKLFENGSGNFAYYVGSATYHPPPGEMFMKELE